MAKTFLFLRDPALQGLMRPAAEALRADGHRVLFAKRKLRWGDAGRTTVDVDPAVLAKANVIVAGPGSPVTRAMMAAAPDLEGLSAVAAGCDAFDVPFATEQGIVVAHGATQEQYDSMAEGTIALMLALLYRVTWAERSLHGGWQGSVPRHAWMLQGRTVGLIGYGPIAQGVARRLEGWGARLIAWTRSRSPGETDGEVTFADRETVMAEADILSLHLRHVPDTEKLIDAAMLDRMKPTSVIVNTGRGAVVDERAMTERLADGRLAGAALDAFAVEPLAMTSPLRRLDNVVLTPHNIGHTAELLTSVRDTLIENLRRIARRKTPVIVKNPEVLDRWLAR